MTIKLIKFAPNATVKTVTDPSIIAEVYDITNFVSFKYDLSTPITPAPLPEEGAEQNVLVKLEGNTSKIKISWWIKDFSISKVANRTVKKVSEQLDFFKKYFVPVSIEDAYALVYIHGGGTTITEDNHIAWYGSFSNVEFTASSDSPVAFRATANFLEGTVITVFDLDVPSKPTNLTLTRTAEGIDVTWTEPNSNAGATINGWVAKVTEPNGNISIHTRDNAQRLFQIIQVIPGDTIVEVAARTNDGQGLFAKETIYA